VKLPSLPLLAFMSCGVIWGSTFLAIRIGNDYLPPLWACSLRLALAALLLNGVLFASGQRWPKGEALKAAVWYGFLEFGVSFPLLYFGERVVQSGLAAVLYAICPITAMFAAKLLKMEDLNAKRLGAATLALGGVAVIFWRELTAGGAAAGMFSVFCAAVAAPVAGLMLQRAPRQNAFGANAVGVLIGLPCSLAVSFLLREPHRVDLGMRELFPVIYLAIMGSLGAFVIFAWLVQHWRATSAAFLGVVVPVIAVVVGAVARHETLNPASGIGAAIVIIGVALALRSDPPARPVEA
jgi:drug/metabolite transporter (DMT)-like permease